MIFSVVWLREWLYLEKDINNIADQITMFGLHVETIVNIPYYISRPIIGHIIYYKRLSKNRYVYSVDIGYKKLLDIIYSSYIEQYACFKIAVAISGSETGSGSGSSISGSIGNLWLLSDIDISYQHNIIKLPLETKLGSELRTYIKIEDIVIKINIAPNKIHCSNMLGIMRVLSCLNNMYLKYPAINYVKTAFTYNIPTLIETNRLCPCFVTRIIRNVNNNLNTSLWLRERLKRCGIILTNVLNDITSYVLLELGQPIDMFDLNSIKEKLAIRLSKPNEVITLFNGNKIALNSNALVISDEANILSLVGISKAKYGSITIDTNNIILCAFYINPSVIIGKPHYSLCSKLLGHYERGVDYNLLSLAIERISDLIISICGGIASSIYSFISTKNVIKKSRIGIHRYKLNNLIGYLIPDGKVNSILTNLNYKAIRVNAVWIVLIHNWRFNINIEEDLIEEVISFYGFCNVNKKPMHTYLAFTETNKSIKTRIPLIRIKELLIDRGYHEVITYSFIEPNIQNKIASNVKHIYIKNPIAKEMKIVRSSLLAGLIKSLTYKLYQQQKRIRLFESGFCFIPDKTIGIKQMLMVAGIITGSILEEHWDSKHSHSLVDIYDIKGDLECIFVITNKANEVELKPISCLVLHPSQSVAIFIKKNFVGLFGTIHPKLQLELKLYNNVFMFELYCEYILDYNMPNASKKSYFPISHRYVSIIVSNQIMASTIISELTNKYTNYLVSINVSDVYYDNIKEGFKSLSLSFNIQSSEKPLKEYDINLIIKDYITTLKHMFSAYLRY
ncbi:phenylalanine--tRNA ligase subunit beta [Candidatus Tremblaya phenacola]|uniref:phenylalanine--tRNA ligase subunit beta n=1 Tax=Candidatus Tremblayella phenacoccinincola TaxID=1010676 RepID=UPI00132FA8D5|nr:phenylalanine--tRNA ligase subunit beta [Candidatus Tremblaya phenacola]KAH0998149.1 Phenylalanyl-tRNA synthetase beta chain [Candidatus Tremblaya phenacola]